MTEPTQTPTPIDPHSPLANTAVMLAAARSTAIAWKEEIQKATEAFQAAHGEKFNVAKLAVENVATLEASLRALIIDAFKATKNKEPLPGLKIREESETILEYDAAKREEWCREKGMFLVVDVAAFEAMAVASPTSVPFVKITETKTPVATIAKDLTATVAAVLPAPSGVTSE